MTGIDTGLLFSFLLFMWFFCGCYFQKEQSAQVMLNIIYHAPLQIETTLYIHGQSCSAPQHAAGPSHHIADVGLIYRFVIP